MGFQKAHSAAEIAKDDQVFTKKTHRYRNVGKLVGIDYRLPEPAKVLASRRPRPYVG
jgi:hypothetical protein